MAPPSTPSQPYIIQYSRRELVQLRPFAAFPFAEYVLPPTLYAPNWQSRPQPCSPIEELAAEGAKAQAASNGVERAVPPAVVRKVPGSPALTTAGAAGPAEAQVGVGVKGRVREGTRGQAVEVPPEGEYHPAVRTTPLETRPQATPQADSDAKPFSTPNETGSRATKHEGRAPVREAKGKSVDNVILETVPDASSRTAATRKDAQVGPKEDIERPGESAPVSEEKVAKPDVKTARAPSSSRKRLIHGALGLPTPRGSPRSAAAPSAAPAPSTPIRKASQKSSGLPSPVSLQSSSQEKAADNTESISVTRQGSADPARLARLATYVRDVPTVDRTLTEEELDARILRIRAENRKLEEHQSKIDRDVINHSPTKEMVQEDAQLMLEEARERNRAKKLKGQGEREWDMEKSSSPSAARPQAGARRSSAPFHLKRTPSSPTQGGELSPATSSLKAEKPRVKGRAASSSTAAVAQSGGC